MKKGVLFAVAIVLVGAAAAWADVTGNWNISGNAKIKVKVQGQGSEAAGGAVTDEFVFDPNGDFEMTDMGGTWSAAGKKVYISLDSQRLSDYFYQYLEEGLEAEFDDAEVIDLAITLNSFSCKENRNGTLKGSWKLLLNCRVDIYVDGQWREFAVSVNSKINFTGSRASAASGTGGLSGDTSAGALARSGVSGEALIESLAGKIREAISDSGSE
jgi:hypothetical protein